MLLWLLWPRFSESLRALSAEVICSADDRAPAPEMVGRARARGARSQPARGGPRHSSTSAAAAMITAPSCSIQLPAASPATVLARHFGWRLFER